MICVLAGGVGAARFLDGLVRVVAPADVVVVANVGDDTVLHGLHVRPDLDTLVYTLAGAVNPDTGWGLRDESWNAMTSLERYGGRSWFRLGDRDLGTHLYRTDRLAEGATLGEVTAEIAAAWGLGLRIVPVTDQPVRTMVTLGDGTEVGFQDYFVRLGHSVEVTSIRFAGAEQARPAPGVLDAIEGADAVVIAPSNPLVSIDPVLAVPGVAEAVGGRREATVAVSPIVGGSAVKGPAARLLTELGHEASALGVARHYRELVATLVVDEVDAALADQIAEIGMGAVVTDTIMSDADVAAALARTTLAAVGSPV